MLKDYFIFGKAGDDRIGDKLAAGYSRDDRFYGGIGQDTLTTCNDSDKLFGGSGLDNFTVFASDGDWGKNVVRIDGGAGIDNLFLHGFSEDDTQVDHFMGYTILKDGDMKVIVAGNVEQWEFLWRNLLLLPLEQGSKVS